MPTPEVKRWQTMGYGSAKRITIGQMNKLVAAGYDGDVVMKWTRYHAGQEIDKLVSHGRVQPPAVTPKKPKQKKQPCKRDRDAVARIMAELPPAE